MGALAVRIGQPRVVGEMMAGIMLGPSLLGWGLPGVFEFLFPQGSVGLLNSLAQIGVILFLFLIGLELDPKLLRRRGQAALVISHMSIIMALLSGATLTLFLYPLVFNDSPNMRFTAVALFIGAAMSVTAFPVLARILSERQMLRSNVGATAITCAAIDDVTAWCMLAFVLAVARAEGLASGVTTAIVVAAYVLIMIFIVRPSLRRLEVIHEKSPAHANGVFAIVLLLVLISSSLTELFGIHALFGAFLLGAIMPKETGFVHAVTRKLEDFIIIFLLPIFFAYAGLRTRIGLLDNPYLWGLTAVVILTACFAKFGGSFIAGRVVGLPLRESAAVGILMNTRGLMELVILTIGLQIGVITDAVFAMMVLMALVTTAMTTPLLNLVLPRRLIADEGTVDERTALEEFGVLVPIAQPETGRAFARLVFLFGSGSAQQTKLYALALTRFSPHEAFSGALEDPEAPPSDALSSLVEESSRLGIQTEALTFPSRDIPSDIARVARAKKADLVLMGFHKPVFGHAILGGTVHRVLTGADTDVAIFVNRGLPSRPRVLVPFQGSPHDHLALELAVLLAKNSMIDVTVLHVLPERRESEASETKHSELPEIDFPDTVRIEVVHHPSPIETVLEHAGGHDLIIVGLGEGWGLRSGIFGFRAERIATESPGSLLLVRKHVPHSALESAAPTAELAAAVRS
jgi:Kef-type K+ transport system membrane component KefB/nucleotide-binding universal stress UspA family protein